MWLVGFRPATCPLHCVLQTFHMYECSYLRGREPLAILFFVVVTDILIAFKVLYSKWNCKLKLSFLHAVKAGGELKVLLCSLLTVALDGGEWLDSCPRRLGGPQTCFLIAFVEGISLVSLPGIEPQCLRSPCLSLVTSPPTPPWLPICSNVMHLFILIKWSDS